MFVTWRVPGLDLDARTWLVRARGPLPLPDDIAIVAIDEASLARFGRYPWRRSLTAQMLDQLTGAHSKAIALDVLFSEPTNNADDSALVAAIAKAGNVVTAAQLSRTESGRVVWLRPLPSIEKTAAGVGHVHVSTEVDGVAGSFLVRQADDQGQDRPHDHAALRPPDVQVDPQQAAQRHRREVSAHLARTHRYGGHRIAPSVVISW